MDAIVHVGSKEQSRLEAGRRHVTGPPLALVPLAHTLSLSSDFTSTDQPSLLLLTRFQSSNAPINTWHPRHPASGRSSPSC